MTVGPAGLMDTAAGGGVRTLLTFEARAMGSPLTFAVAVATAIPADADLAHSAWAAVRAEFERAEQAMSRFRETSEVTLLNRRAGDDVPTPVTRCLARALAACDRAHRLTDGRFDPRVLWDLERLGEHGAPIGGKRSESVAGSPRGEDSPPGRRDGRVRTGRRIIERGTGGLISLPEPVDLGGIGKGLALRWAAHAVHRHGIGAFLLDAGGDLVASGEPPEGGPWRIGLEDPRGGVAPLAVIAAADGAVTTSSVRRRQWQLGDRIVHHLIDPRTGEPGGAGLLAVTVAGPDPAWSEVWSKTLFLEGRSGVATLARRRGLAAWWVAEDGSLEMTPGARMRTIWTADERA